jgi:hypothetical protein
MQDLVGIDSHDHVDDPVSSDFGESVRRTSSHGRSPRPRATRHRPPNPADNLQSIAKGGRGLRARFGRYCRDGRAERASTFAIAAKRQAADAAARTEAKAVVERWNTQLATSGDIISVQLLCADGGEMASRRKGKGAGVNPVPFGQLPTRIAQGRILAHNEVDHSVNTTSGRNGFRAWTQPEPAPKGFLKCNCGWAGLPHYRMEGTQ